MGDRPAGADQWRFLYVVPELDTIVVTTARYALPPEQTLDRYLITNFVLLAVKSD
jgi:hypothetical protein